MEEKQKYRLVLKEKSDNKPSNEAKNKVLKKMALKMSGSNLHGRGPESNAGNDCAFLVDSSLEYELHGEPTGQAAGSAIQNLDYFAGILAGFSLKPDQQGEKNINLYYPIKFQFSDDERHKFKIPVNKYLNQRGHLLLDIDFLANDSGIYFIELRCNNKPISSLAFEYFFYDFHFNNFRGLSSFDCIDEAIKK